MNSPPSTPPDLRATILEAWRTSNRVTINFVQRLPAPLWRTCLPGAPRRTVQMVAAHLHNCRCSWLKTLGSEHGITTPTRVDPKRVTPRQLAAALKKSSAGMEALLELGLASGGRVPPSKGYVWRNLSLDVGHVLTYFVMHEGHHRGQVLLAARQTGQRLPYSTTNDLWEWKPPAPKRRRISPSAKRR